MNTQNHHGTIFVAAAIGLALTISTGQAALSLDFANLSSGAIEFQNTGSSHSFQLDPVIASAFSPQFFINHETGGSGAALNLHGWVNNGPWSYGTISVNNSIPGLTIDTALVAGPTGNLVIDDGTFQLTGNVNWIQIQTFNSIGGINASLAVNVTGLSYSGSNPDLSLLASGPNASMNVSFQFSPGKSLTDLSQGGPFATSYSGSISPVSVPEVPTMIAGALVLLPLGASTLRILRKNCRV